MATDSVLAPGRFGPENKHLLKAIKRNTENNENSSWYNARVSKFTFRPKSSTGTNIRDQYTTQASATEFCKCGGAGFSGQDQETLIKDPNSDGDAIKKDYTKTWNLVGPYKNPYPILENHHSSLAGPFYKGLKYIGKTEDGSIIDKYKVTWFYSDNNVYREIGTNFVFKEKITKKVAGNMIESITKDDLYSPEGDHDLTVIDLLKHARRGEDLFLHKDRDNNIKAAPSYYGKKLPKRYGKMLAIRPNPKIEYKPNIAISQQRNSKLCENIDITSGKSRYKRDIESISDDTFDENNPPNMDRCNYLEDAYYGLPDGILKTRVSSRIQELKSLNIQENDLRSNEQKTIHNIDKRGYQSNFPYCAYWDDMNTGSEPWCTLERSQQASFNKNGKPNCFLWSETSNPQKFKKTVTEKEDAITCSYDDASGNYDGIPDIGRIDPSTVNKSYQYSVSENSSDDYGKPMSCFGSTNDQTKINIDDMNENIYTCWGPSVDSYEEGKCAEVIDEVNAFAAGPLYSMNTNKRKSGYFGDLSGDKIGLGTSDSDSNYDISSNKNCSWTYARQKQYNDGENQYTHNLPTQGNPPIVRSEDNFEGRVIDRADPSQLETMIYGASPYINRTRNIVDTLDYYTDDTATTFTETTQKVDDPLVAQFEQKTPMGNPDWHSSYTYETFYTKDSDDNTIISKKNNELYSKESDMDINKSINEFSMWTRHSKSVNDTPDKYHGMWDVNIGSDNNSSVRNVQNF